MRQTALNQDTILPWCPPNGSPRIAGACAAVEKSIMAKNLSYLNRPEYLLQPKAVLRRLFGLPRAPGGLRIVQLNWGLPLEVDTREDMGVLIARTLIFDLCVTEAIFRLTDPADVFLDIGANSGFMSSAAVAAGAKKIVSFEPHPEVFRQLKRNISLWAEVHPRILDRITARQEAVSDKKGTAMLRIPDRRFQRNRGLATLEAGRGGESYSEVEVPTITLTRVVEQCGEPIGVLKIDIEDHELTALTASQDSLQAGRVRDIIFEDHEGMNSKVSQLLSRFGYSVFNLNKTPLGPVLLDSEAFANWVLATGDYNFLATLDPDRALRRMSGRGFMCLRNKHKLPA